MDNFRLRFSRWWLALSLIAKFGLGACLALFLISGPERSAALSPATYPAQALKPDNAIELAQTRKRRLSRRERQRRAAQERARAAEEAAQREKEAREEKERAEAEAREARAKAEREEQARLEAEQRERAAREERERIEAGRSKQRRARAPAKDAEADRETSSAPVDPSGNPLPPEGQTGKTEDGTQGSRDASATGDHLPPPSEIEPEKQTWSDAEVIDALRECVALLGPIASHVDVSTPMRKGQCGTPAPVLVKRVGATTPVDITPPAIVNCQMVAKLHEWVESTLQPAARETFNEPVRRLVSVSGYDCRNRNGTRVEKVSEHAFANAIDISAFVMADGRTVDVLSNWGKTQRDLRAIALAKAKAERAKAEAERQAKAAAEEDAKKEKEPRSDAAKSSKSDDSDEPDRSRHPTTRQKSDPQSGRVARNRQAEADGSDRQVPLPPRAREKQRREALASNERTALGGDPKNLRDVSVEGSGITREGAFLRRLHKGACGIFGTVLGPEANEAHRNHFHLDLAPRRRRAFCE